MKHTIKRKLFSALSLAVILSLLVTSLALADNVQNDVVAGGNDTITAGGSTTINYRITANNGDGQTGCNAADSTPATVTINTPPGVTVDTSGVPGNQTTLTFTSCGTNQSAVFTSNSAGNYPITVSVSDSGTGTYNVNPASFTLHVTAPSDTTPPVISYTLNPASPDGNNGWYRSNVTLTWSVTDPESGVSTTGCVDQNITADQAATDYSCSASSAGGSAGPVTVTIKRDATAPTGVTGEPNRDPDSGTWYNAPVEVVFAGFDATSGLASCTMTNYGGPDGSAIAVNGSCTDNAGNSSGDVASAGFNYDATGPSGVVLSVTDGTAGANGWYTSNVTVSTTGSDDTSGVTCTADQDQTDETAGTEFNGSCTDGAGNTTDAAPLTVKLDKTGPSAALEVTGGTAGTNGWYTSDVTVATSGSDDVSGPVTCTAVQYQTTETAGTTFNGSCTNDAGLSTDATPRTVKLDKTGPSASLSVTAGTAGANGWYTSDVTVSTSGSDTISGAVSCSVDQFQTSETAGAVFNGSCTNNAGLSTSAAPLTVKLDKTGPSASLAITAGTLGSNGWYTSDVTISTSGSDSISSPVTCTTDQFQTTDTIGTAFNGSCTNDAGLSTNAASLTVKLDKTAPSLTWNGGPAAGGTYYFGFVPAAPTCTASDATSGPNGCTISGYGASVGPHTMTAQSYDMAGNSYSEFRSYTVNSWTILGFYQPVDMGRLNVAKNGSTVPLKFEVFAGPTELTDTGVVSAFVQTLTCGTGLPTDDIENYATGGTSLRYDTTGGQFIFNWQTPRRAGNCYRVTLTTQDGLSIFADFKLK